MRAIYSSITEGYDVWLPEHIGRGGLREELMKSSTLVASLHLLAETALVYWTVTFNMKRCCRMDQLYQKTTTVDVKAFGTCSLKLDEAKQVES